VIEILRVKPDLLDELFKANREELRKGFEGISNQLDNSFTLT
jgi:hypothetical protein